MHRKAISIYIFTIYICIYKAKIYKHSKHGIVAKSEHSKHGIVAKSDARDNGELSPFSESRSTDLVGNADEISSVMASSR